MGPQTIMKPPPGTPVEWWFMAILAIGLIQVALAALSAKKTSGAAVNGLKLSKEDREWLRGLIKQHLTTQIELEPDQKNKLDDLHRWHDTHDDDGVPRWVIGSAMRDAMKAMADGIRAMVEGQKQTNRLLQDMSRHELQQNRKLERLLDRSGEHDAVEGPEDDED